MTPLPSRETAWGQLLTALRLVRILATVSRSRCDLVYDVLSDRHVMGDDSLYINLGYWKDARSLDEAAGRLAELLAERTGFRPGDRVLDAGFGFADQDIRWATAYRDLHISGVNVSTTQVRAAQDRVRRAGLADRIDLRVGDAVATPFADISFDAVVALESAFHFRSREAFFAEAHRVLRPGGRIGTADFVAAPIRPHGLRPQLARLAGVLSWQIPSRNLIPRERYEQRMRAAGFRDVRVESIGEHVFAPFEAFQRRRFDTPEFRARYHPLVRLMAKFQIDWGFLRGLDYVIATGTK